MKKGRRVPRVAGDVVAIPLGGRRHAFGLVLEEPLVAFLDLCANDDDMPNVTEILRAPVAFRVWVMNDPIICGDWPVIGRVDIPRKLLEKPWFFKEDPISGETTVGRTGDEERAPKPGQVKGLERAAVWSASHIKDRLTDHFAGRPNQWVESLRPQR